jgi:hypothetical protein
LAVDAPLVAALASTSRAILTLFWTRMPTPGLSPADAVEEGAVQAAAVLEVADAPLAAGAPLDEVAEPPAVLDFPSGGGGLALAGDRHLLDAEALELGLDGGLPLGPIGGESPGDLAEEGLDAADPGASRPASAGLPTTTL